MQRIGITGGIGSGKSVVARIIHAMGYPVFYSDEVAKKITNTDSLVKSKLIELCGSEIYVNGLLDRKEFASRIFSHPELKEKVNDLIHPAVRNAFNEFCSRQKSSLVFNEAAILFETGAYKAFDKIILVTAPEDLRIERVTLRDRSNESEIRNRIKNQWTDQMKIPLADYIVINDNLQPVLKQTQKVITSLEEH